METKGMITETFKNTKGQVVGALHHDKAYRTVRQKNKHLLLVMEAWGIDKSIAHEESEPTVGDAREGGRQSRSTAIDRLPEHHILIESRPAGTRRQME